MTILIAGGTGLIGTRLSRMLRDKGYEVLHLSRRRNLDAEFPAYKWNLKNGKIDEEPLRKANTIINLAGAGIADARWTDARKKLIIDSRVDAALLMKKYIDNGIANPKSYISASAIGYYGNSGEDWVDENSPPRNGEFLSDSTRLWEEAIQKVAGTGTRTVALRVGIVLSTKGGALEKMLLSFNVGVGSYFGNGKMWTSWIHIDDVCGMFLKAIENEKMKGIYNAVAPNPARNIQIIETIKEVKNHPSVLIPAPIFALKLALGEMSAAVLGSTKVSGGKILNVGYEFQFPNLRPALKDLMKNKK